LDFDKKNFFEEYAKNQAAVEKCIKKAQSIRQRALACIKFVIVAPARLFILLPDREYQNLLIRYYNLIKIFKRT